MDLPTSVFERTRYWLDSPGASAAPKPARPTGDNQTPRYRVGWKALPDTAAQPTALGGTWLLLASAHADQAAATDRIRRSLAEHGAEVLTIEVPEDTADRTTISTLISARTADLPPAGVVSLLALDQRPGGRSAAFYPGLASTIAALQALGDTGIDAPVWCVTGGAVCVDDGETLRNPLQAQMWGLGVVFGLDHAARWGGLIDLPCDTTDRVTTSWDEQVLGRFCRALADSGDENEVAVRSTATFARRLVSALPKTDAVRRRWAPRGTVLITGGTGQIGARVARWVAANGAERIVLTNRRGLEAPGARELIAELEALGAGARVDVETCDLADRAALGRLIAQLKADGLSAVVHAAGIGGEGKPLADTDPDEFAAVLDAKATAAAHLDDLLADTPLDAFVLCSSGAGVWGDAGHSAYAAANAYLNALAEHRRTLGRTATCVAWGAWGGGGMVDEAEAKRLARNGMRLMDPDAALRTLIAAVDDAECSLVVADVDWPRFAELYRYARRRPLLDDLPEARGEAAEQNEAKAHGEDARQRFTAMTAQERDRELLRVVRAQTAKALGFESVEPVRPQRPFRELGIDSLTAVEVRNKLNALTGTNLPVTAVFDHPTPAALARLIADQLTPAASQHAGSDAALSSVSALDPLAALALLEPSLAIGSASDAPGAGADDEQVRREVTNRLRSLLRRWETHVPDGTAAAGDGFEPGLGLDEVSDEEMFELIERELGQG